MKKFKDLLVKIGLLVISTYIVLHVAEYFVTQSYFQKKSPSPSLTYNKFTNIIDNNTYIETKWNRYGFRIDPGLPQKPNNVKRIVVMGDSFIWGLGLTNAEDIWSRQLAKIISAISDNIDVVDFGNIGWSTQTQYLFLKEKGGLEYSPDLIIWGFVTNDPDMGKTPHYHQYRAVLPYYVKKYLPFIKNQFPNVLFFIERQIVSLTNRYITKYIHGGNWEDRLYNKENLDRYEQLLKEIKVYFDELNIPFFFVTLPHAPHRLFKERIDKIVPIMERCDIPILNTYYVIEKKFAHISRRRWKFTLAANPGNSHPGKLLNEVFAEETLKYIKQNYQYLGLVQE